MADVYEESVELHRVHGGKLEIKSKVPLNSREDLSRAYTPGVGRVVEEIAKNPKLAGELTLKKNSVAIVSDGSAILGLGNLGALAAIPVMEGKALLFKEFGGVDAWPICLDTQDTEEIIKAVKLIAPVFGGINLEDISAPRCFEVEKRLKEELDIPVMHDDQWGTAVVVLAGLINALKVTGKNKETARVIINGVGAAGTAISRLILKFGFSNLILCDSQGPIYAGRENLNETKKELAELTNQEKISGGLVDALVGADIFIGVSKANLLTPEMIKIMKPQPIIFAMANPVPEIMPDVARSAGAAIVATGRSDFANQINNVLVFPGIFRGALDHGVKKITEDMLLNAAQALAGLVPEPTAEKIIPGPFEPGVADTIAAAIK